MAQVVTSAETIEAAPPAGLLADGELGKPVAAGTDAVSKPKESTPSEAHAAKQRRELIRTLSRGKLASLVADVNQFDLRQACRVTKIALEEDPDFDKKLIELVKSGTATQDQIVRILAVLESVCAAPRLLYHVLDLKNSEGRVRSKLTLMVARLTRDPQWLRQQLEDENPRVRANAIEGMWDVRAEGLESLLHTALNDPHHRVAANAALALYKIGDASAVFCIYEMLRHPDPMFRRAALWAIGQSRDPRFLQAVLDSLENSPTNEHLTNAIRVKEELRSSLTSYEFAAPLSLEASRNEINESGDRVVRICCVAESVGGWLGQRDVNAVNFVVHEGDRQIEKYRVRWVNDSNPFVALIIQPRSWNGYGELFKPALRGAGVRETYGFLPYQTLNSSVRGKEHDDASEVKFENFSEVSKEYLGRNYEVAKDLGVAINIGLSTIQKQVGRRHIFVLVDPSVGEMGGLTEPLTSTVGDTQVNALVWDKASPALQASLRDLTVKSGGHFAVASSAREFTKMLMSVRAAHFGNLEITWEPVVKDEKGPVRISCYSAYGNGEVCLL